MYLARSRFHVIQFCGMKLAIHTNYNCVDHPVAIL